MIQRGNEVITIGGLSDADPGWQSNQNYKLGCLTQGCTWQTMATQLTATNHYHVSVVVPDNFFNCP